MALAPILAGAEPLTRPVRYRLYAGGEVVADPANPASLEAAAAAITRSALHYHPDCNSVTVARRQLGDIAVTMAQIRQVESRHTD